MNSFLRNRTPSRQFGLLLVFVFGTLLLAAPALGLSLRDAREDGAQCWRPHEFNIVLSTFLVMSAGRLALGVTSLAGSVSGGLAYSNPTRPGCGHDIDCLRVGLIGAFDDERAQTWLRHQPHGPRGQTHHRRRRTAEPGWLTLCALYSPIFFPSVRWHFGD